MTNQTDIGSSGIRVVETKVGIPVLNALIAARKLDIDNRTDGQRFLVEQYEHFVNHKYWSLDKFLCSVVASEFWKSETEANAFI